MSAQADITTGLYADLPAVKYHADPCPQPSLNCGVIKTLIAQSPAHAWLQHPRLGGSVVEPTPAMDMGGYVHVLVAGDASEYEVLCFDDLRSKDAKTARDSVKLAGRTPILEKHADRARKIADSIKQKSFSGITYNPLNAGRNELTAVWQEEGLWFRSRFDSLVMPDGDAGSADIWDYKTTTDVSTDAILRTIINQQYDVQAAFYMRGLRAVMPKLAGRITFIFVFVEVEPPFAVRRVCLSEGFLSIASAKVARGIRTWKQCLSTDAWPDYSADTITMEPPTYYVMRAEEREGGQ